MSRTHRRFLHTAVAMTLNLAGGTLLLLTSGSSPASLIGCLLIGLLCGITAHAADRSIR